MGRRVVLLIVGVVSILRGWSYLGPSPHRTPTQLELVDQFISLTIYSSWWIVAGALAIAAAFVRSVSTAALGGILALNALWFISFQFSWLVLDSERAWVSSINYLLVAVLLWREVTRPEPVVFQTIRLPNE